MSTTTDDPITIDIELRSPDGQESWKEPRVGWTTSEPNLVIHRSVYGWGITHTPSGLLITRGICCVEHGREFVTQLGPADWNADLDTIFADRTAYAESVHAAGQTWRCDLYERLVTLDQAAAIVSHPLGPEHRDLVRATLERAITEGVVELATNYPEMP